MFNRLIPLAFFAALAAPACSVGSSVVGGRDSGADLNTPEVADDVVDTLDTPDVVDAPDVVDVVDAPDAADVPFRCASSAECTRDPAAPVCDVSTGQCIACSAAEDRCPRGRYCVASMNRCTDGCRTDDDCTGSSADAGTSVDAGAAGAHCDAVTHACVACVTDAHCPPGNLCAGHVCAPGCSAGHACPGTDTCCGGACVDTNSNVASCGACDALCTTAHATPACMNGQCAVGACTAPFADCDRSAANGCEVDTSSTVAHCSGCGMACATRAHSTTTCASGTCNYACETGFADCDGNAANGCEVDTRTDTANCGRCASACVLSNATATCAAGQCAVGACATGFADCDGSALNGCEVDTRSSVANCGACGTACPSRPNGFPGCVASACVVACQSGFQDCDGVAETGCEADTRTSATHCGGCGRACALASATSRCNASACELVSCNAGAGNCDGNSANGCETNTNTTVTNCGACGTVCSAAANATATCAGGTCGNTCNTGFGNCDGSAANGCETNTLTTSTHCGACGNVCAAGTVCVAGACAATTSCATLYTARPTTPSGIYAIDPDGAGGSAPFRVWCDMGVDGGWTMAFVKNSADNRTYPDIGAAATRVESLANDPAALSTSATGVSGWLDLNTFAYATMRLGAYEGGVRTYTSRDIPRTELRIRFGQPGYLLHGGATRYYWCNGPASYTDDGAGQVNQPTGGLSDCKGHTSLGSGWDFSEVNTANSGLTLCGNDRVSRWMYGRFGGPAIYVYPATGATQVIWVQ